MQNATSVLASPNTSSAPAHQIPSSTPAVCQCAGRRTATVDPGPAPNSSRSMLAVLAAQLASVAVESSMRSPAASS
ncbi:Uncharacterised protein [Mycobacteroides abscessus subsp. abscessus]|nr:Uncharacterised protein [Mycobacteroides abscessus subsp. abscessus]